MYHVSHKLIIVYFLTVWILLIKELAQTVRDFLVTDDMFWLPCQNHLLDLLPPSLSIILSGDRSQRCWSTTTGRTSWNSVDFRLRKFIKWQMFSLNYNFEIILNRTSCHRMQTNLSSAGCTFIFLHHGKRRKNSLNQSWGNLNSNF